MEDGQRILIVEDRQTDAELAEREIRRVLPGSEFLRVETRKEYLAALASFEPDVILSDYTLPSFDGMSALKLALERTPETPFIMFTGSMNEDTAVGCLRAGAWDYVIKEHIKRLGPAVKSGLEQRLARRRQMLAELELQARNRGFLIVANASVSLAALQSERGIYAFTARTLKELTGSATTTFGLYDPAGRCISVKHAEHDPGVVNDLVRALEGKRLTEASFPVSDALYERLRRDPIGYRLSLSEATFGIVPDLVGKVVQKLQGIDRFLGIAYWLEGALYGTSVVALRAQTPDPAPDLVSLFAQLVAVSLRRVRMEKALRESEDRFKHVFESANVAKSVTLPTGRDKHQQGVRRAAGIRAGGAAKEEVAGYHSTGRDRPDSDHPGPAPEGREGIRSIHQALRTPERLSRLG